MNRTVSAVTDPAAPSEAAFLSAEICPDCVKQDGLCKRHIPSVCPNLAQPGWYRLVGTSFYGKAQAEREKDIATQRLLGRKERKRQRAEQRAMELRQLVEDIATPKAA